MNSDILSKSIWFTAGIASVLAGNSSISTLLIYMAIGFAVSYLVQLVIKKIMKGQ